MQVFTIGDLVQQGAQKFANRVAVNDPDRALTYKELQAEAERLARHLVDRGVQKGDRVAILAGNNCEQVIALLSVALSGGAFVNINAKFRKNQVEHVLTDTGARYVLVGTTQQAQWEVVMEDAAVEVVMITSAPTAGATLPRVIDRDLAALIYTSGSTGKPKGIMYTHGDALMLARTNVELYHVTAQDVILSTMPWSSDYPLTTLYAMLLVGGTMILRDTFLASDIVDALQSENITGYASATPMWSILYGEKSPFPNADFPSLRFIAIGGGYPPQHVMQTIMDKFEGKTDIYTLYGLTEGHWSAYVPPEELRAKYGSIGIPIPNVELQVVNRSGAVCEVGEEGILVHRGGVVGRGYWQNPSKSAETFRTGVTVVPEPLREQETVLFTGDVVTRDADGYFFFKGREDKQIKVQGYRVAVEDIVDAMYDSKLIESGCVVAVKAEFDQKIIACVTPKKGEADIKDAILAHVRATLPSYMVPSEIFVLAEMPYTISQKIDVERLKTWYEANKLGELEIDNEKARAS